MKRTFNIVIAVAVLACLTGCKSESYSESKTDVQLSTTKDGETTEQNFSSEAKVDVSADENNAEITGEVAVGGGKYDSSAYDVNYLVNDTGNVVIYVPETAGDWWRMISFSDRENTMEFVADEVDEDGIYYVEIKPSIKDGAGKLVMAHYTSDSSEDAVDFAIMDLNVEGGQVVEITNTGFTDDLDSTL